MRNVGATMASAPRFSSASPSSRAPFERSRHDDPLAEERAFVEPAHVLAQADHVADEQPAQAPPRRYRVDVSSSNSPIVPVERPLARLCAAGR